MIKMSSEYRIPHGDHHPDSQESSVRAEINDIFQNQIASSGGETVSDVAEKLRVVAKDIARARAYRLDSQFFTQVESRNRFKKALSSVLFNHSTPVTSLESLTEEALIKQECALVSPLFLTGASAYGFDEHIKFFNQDIDNWYFYQSLTDRTTKSKTDVTLHYEIVSHGVLKISSRPDVPNEIVSGQELANFVAATETYRDKVLTELYGTGASQTSGGVYQLHRDSGSIDDRLAA